MRVVQLQAIPFSNSILIRVTPHSFSSFFFSYLTVVRVNNVISPKSKRTCKLTIPCVSVFYT